MGGRIRHSDLSVDAKHPVLIPKESPLATLIVRDIHQSTGHQGRNAGLAELRRQYWIPQAGTLIRSVTSRCVTCRRYQARPLAQQMADLPPDRLSAHHPPFSHIGMDFLGPLEVKRGSSSVKRYGVIFTCSSSRAIHLEVAYSLTTDSCISAIRRFLARRGPVMSIRSDNGTNIVGAEAEMKREIQAWNQSDLGHYLLQRSVQWKFNPPSASNFGGFWERLIHVVRKVLYSILRDHPTTVTDEDLHTLLCEVEQIINNRPITQVSSDPSDMDALTPNQLVTMKADAQLPPGLFFADDNYARRRWRMVQHLANLFWSRWLKEYVPLLQKRQKWVRPQRNAAIDDVVLIVDNVPRNVWTMGRIVSIQHDDKGLVRTASVKTKSNT